ncbi:MAG: sugar phosphate isomerase/epimerase family protein [Fimbriimonas sp.]
MQDKLAAQLYTLREHTQTARDFDNALGICHEIGYPAVQLSAVGCMNGESPELDAHTARRMLDHNGLKCCATHRSWEALRDRTDEEIEFHLILGCNYVAIGGIWPKDPNEYRQFVADSKPVIERLKQAGIRFGYHNHSHEFQRNEATGEPWYEVLIEEGGPDLMLEIDTYWVQHAGVDPADLVFRCAGRVPVIHVKDKEVVPGDGPVFAPIGEGNFNWENIIDAGEDAGVEWYVVEQDTCRRDPFDCLKSSFDYLTGFTKV